MIRYRRGLFVLANLCNLKAGVFIKCFPLSFLVATMSALLKFAVQEEWLDVDEIGIGNFLTNNAAYTGLVGIIGFLVIFRTQQAYSRFWDSCNQLKKMQAEFFVTGSNLIAFSRHGGAARVNDEEVLRFSNLIVRLLSLLHAMCLMTLHYKDGPDDQIKPEVIDAKGIDREALQMLANEECKVELICQWIQSVTVDAISTHLHTIPPPIMSRIFQNLSNGLSAFYSAYRVAEIPYPFPYMQTTEYLLCMNFMVCPLAIMNFVNSPFWAFVFSFFNIFTLLALHVIAAELEDPFGVDPNDIDLLAMQQDMNKRLLMLLSKPGMSTVPKLNHDAPLSILPVGAANADDDFAEMTHSMSQAFEGVQVCTGIGSAKRGFRGSTAAAESSYQRRSPTNSNKPVLQPPPQALTPRVQAKDSCQSNKTDERNPNESNQGCTEAQAQARPACSAPPAGEVDPGSGAACPGAADVVIDVSGPGDAPGNEAAGDLECQSGGDQAAASAKPKKKGKSAKKGQAQ